MNRIAIAAISLILVCFFSIAHAQVTPQSLQIVQATYGAGENQIDVTQKVQAAIASGQTDIRASNSFFRKDPAFGKVKTLAVTFVQGGVQYQTTVREGEQISFAKANVDQSNIAPHTPPAPVPAEHPQLVGHTEAQTLSPGVAMWLVQRIVIKTNGGVTGILPGTRVTLVEDHGEKLLVSDGSQTFEASREQVTTDAAVAQGTIASDQAAQNAVRSNIATSIREQEQATATANAQQEAAAKEKAAKAQTRQAAQAQEEKRQQESQLARRPVASSLQRIGGGGGSY
jgi:hypothetical protein